MIDNGRYEREADFHNHCFGEETRQAVESFYSITHSSSKAMYRQYLATHCKDRLVLEYGCGVDGHSAFMARCGGMVTGIDLSPVAIDISRQLALRQGDTRSQYVVMNAECLEFAAGTFDMICGMGILHHLDLKKSLAELARVLRPDGSAIFLEPLGHNPVINLYRRLTPSFRTPDEHPLLAADLVEMENYFAKQDLTFFHLTSLAAVPFYKLPGFQTLLQRMDRLDQWLFRRSAFFRKQAWAVVITLSEPRKASV